MENEGLTPTHKIRRHHLSKKFEPEIKAMYERIKSTDFQIQLAIEEALKSSTSARNSMFQELSFL